MSIKSYFENEKQFYEVFVKGRDSQGRQTGRRKKRISSETKAKRIEFELKKELDDIANQRTAWTWGTWHTECLNRMKLSYRQKTVENYDLGIRKWIPKDWSSRSLTIITKNDVHEVIFATMAGASDTLKRDVHRRVHRLFELAVEEGILSLNPAKGIKVKVAEPKQKVLNSNEAEILLKNAKETKHRFYPVWAMALKTGMRSGEMYALRWSDIDFETEMISVSKQWTSKDGLHPTKSGRNRLVPVSPDLKKFLAEMKLKGGYEESLIDGMTKKEVWHDDYVLPRLYEWNAGLQAQILADFCESIGITKVKFHDLRATFITNMLVQGVSLVAVMSIVGHSRMSTTDRYVRLAGVGVKGATKQLSYSIPETQPGQLIQLFGKTDGQAG
ncbi:MAG: hypothetical protein JWQ35_1613 [Bacteriovoracaceae bacterium]|nr:hypothetical protein [Bacteriovoracaceae bacterium]